MDWRIECKYSGAGFDFTGNLDDVVARAREECGSEHDRMVVWLEPANVRMAEVTLRGAAWLKSTLTGEDVVKLMRRHRKTIAELAFVMGIPQKRIRQVRENGLEDRNAVRDWLEATTGEDVGPLPEKFRIRRRDEEAECCYCGYPLFIGDVAFEYAGAVFCSVTCSRSSRQKQEIPT